MCGNDHHTIHVDPDSEVVRELENGAALNRLKAGVDGSDGGSLACSFGCANGWHCFTLHDWIKVLSPESKI